MNFISSRKNCFSVDSCSSGGAVTLSRTASSPLTSAAEASQMGCTVDFSTPSFVQEGQLTDLRICIMLRADLGMRRQRRTQSGSMQLHECGNWILNTTNQMSKRHKT